MDNEKKQVTYNSSITVETQAGIVQYKVLAIEKSN